MTSCIETRQPICDNDVVGSRAVDYCKKVQFDVLNYAKFNEDALNKSKIVKFYQDKSILITGASGFIGKVLIEKLLRTCSGVKNIYILLRPKKHLSPKERLNLIINLPLFDAIRASDAQNNQNFLSKIKVLDGDITEHNFGLSQEHLNEVIQEVSVVFHSAASVRFEEPIKTSVNINIVGVKHLIEICRQLKNLQAVVQVSTAYANCDRDSIDEHVYPVKMDPEKLIAMANWLEQDTIQMMKEKLVCDKPNTYTYTKSLAEYLLVKKARDLPVVICRPSIVCASLKEPMAGWIDNVNGPTGIILGAGKGLIRTMHAESSYVADLIPVDHVTNLAITLGWFANEYHKTKKILPLGSEDSMQISSSDHGSLLGEEELDSAVTSCSESEDREKLIANGNILEDEGYGSGANSYLKQTTTQTDSNAQPTLPTMNTKAETEIPKENPIDTSDVNKKHQRNCVSNKEQQQQTISSSYIDNNNITMNNSVSDDQAKMIKFRNSSRAKLLAKSMPEEFADIPVFHCTSGSKNPIYWGQVEYLVLTLCALFPFSQTLRYPGGSFTNIQLWDRINKVIFHTIPAYIVDFITRLSGGKPILVRIYDKFDQAADVLQVFTMHQWHFDTSNNVMLQEELMSNEDKQLFDFSLDQIDWHNYFEIYILGVRQYMLKEPNESLDEARKNLKFIYYRNLAMQVISFAIVTYIFLSKYL